MITVTALNSLRCSLRPELIASVAAGPPTTVVLTNGVSLEVREPLEEVQRRLDLARGPAEAATTSTARGHHGRAR